MVAATWRLPGLDDIMMAEAGALLATVRLVMDCGFRRVVFEGDNESLIRRIQNGKIDDRSYLGSFIMEIQSLQYYFDKCQFSFIPRCCNKVADSLAHLAHTDPNKVWIEEVPIVVHDVYFHDLIQ